MAGRAPTGRSLTGLEAFQKAGALREQGRLPDAERLYRAILKADPDHGESWHCLGLIRAQQGKTEDAIKLIRKAVRLKPELAEAHNNLGVMLRASGRAAEAIPHFETARALQPGFVEPRYNLGNALQALDRLDEALARYDEALALKPDYADAWSGRGSALTMLGRIDEARQAFETAIKHAPRRAAFYLNLAETKDFAAGDPLLAAIETLAADKDVSANDRIDLHFAAGKALADLGEFARSFEHLLAGNALRHRQVAYDEAATLREFERIASVFTPELLRAKQGDGDPSELPVFIVGMPRSGTTLVEQILASHPQVFGAGELDHLDQLVPRLAGAKAFPEIVGDLSAERLRAFGAAYVERLRAASPTAERITDKMPANFRHLGLIHLALPKARIIHVRRDPVDTCVSCFSKLFKTGLQPHTYDLAELGRYYVAYEKLMAHWRRVLPQVAMLEVQYEELVAGLEPQARRIVAHCGLAWNDTCLAFHTASRSVRTASAAQVRRPIYRQSIGRWRAYGELLRPLLDALKTPPAS